MLDKETFILFSLFNMLLNLSLFLCGTRGLSARVYALNVQHPGDGSLASSIRYRTDGKAKAVTVRGRKPSYRQTSESEQPRENALEVKRARLSQGKFHAVRVFQTFNYARHDFSQVLSASRQNLERFASLLADASHQSRNFPGYLATTCRTRSSLLIDPFIK